MVLKALPSASSHEVPSALNQPEDSGPELEASKLEESAPSASQPSEQVQEQISRASDTDSGKADEPTQHQLVEPVAKERVLPLPRSFPLRLGHNLLQHPH